MIIKVQQHKPRSLLRIFIAATILICSFSYYFYHIVYKTEEDNKAFDKKVIKIKKDKKEAVKLQRIILNESEKIISIVGASNIIKIKMIKNKLHVYVSNDKYINIFVVRYKNMLKISKVNNLWDLSINLEKLISNHTK